MRDSKLIFGIAVLLFFSILIEMFLIIFTYNVRKNNVNNNEIITVSPATIVVSHKLTNKIVIEKFDNNFVNDYQFDISNTSYNDIRGNYTISLEIIEPVLIVNKNDVLYDLICITNSTNNKERVSNLHDIRMPSGTSIIGDGTIFTGKTHNCVLSIKFSGKIEDYENKKFVANINVKSYAK